MDDFLGELFGGIFELFGELIAHCIVPVFQLWFSSVWSFLTGSGIFGAIGYAIYYAVTH